MKDNEPLSTRAARMKLYMQLVGELDAGGTQYSQDLSEVDLTDPDDVKVTVTDPHGEVLVHLGGSDLLERFKIYKAHVQEWRSQFQKLDSVDLRYDRQVIVNPDSQAVTKPVQPKVKAASTTPAAKNGDEETAVHAKHRWAPKHKQNRKRSSASSA